MINAETDAADRDRRFEMFYRAHFRDVARFVSRRVSASDAPDVLSHVFTVAWRRFEQIPPPPEDRLWLFGVARRSIADHRRSGHRRLQMHQRLFDQFRPVLAGGEENPILAHVEASIARLRPKDREVLRLVMWDDLTHAEAAAILGCSLDAIEHRLRRARTRVRAALAHSAEPVDPVAPHLVNGGPNLEHR